MSQRLLFSGLPIFDVMESQKQRFRDELQRLPVPMLDDADTVQNLIHKYDIKIPVLHEDRKYAKKRDIQIDVSHDPRRLIIDRSRPFYIPGTQLSVFMPFEGDGAAFDIRPSAFDLNPPRGDVIRGELCVTYEFTNAPANLSGECEQDIAKIKKYLGWLEPSASQLHSELQHAAQAIVSQRKKQAAEHDRVFESLGIPIQDDTLSRRAANPTASPNRVARQRPQSGWDVFISHASEDKNEIARPLANALKENGISVWYDEFSLKIGDSLRQSIDYGLAHSKFGVVILSRHFFEKHWPQQELNGLANRELGGKKVILPVWHKVNREGVARYSPILADRLAAITEVGLEQVVKKIMEAMW